MMKGLVVVLLLALALRFAILVWRGYRDQRVRLSGPWVPNLARQSQPVLYWLTMGAHSFVAVSFVGCVVAMLLGLVPLRQ